MYHWDLHLGKLATLTCFWWMSSSSSIWPLFNPRRIIHICFMASEVGGIHFIHAFSSMPDDVVPFRPLIWEWSKNVPRALLSTFALLPRFFDELLPYRRTPLASEADHNRRKMPSAKMVGVHSTIKGNSLVVCFLWDGSKKGGLNYFRMSNWKKSRNALILRKHTNILGINC